MKSPVKVWRNQKNITALLGKTGEIISWTYIRVPPSDFGDQAPYPVVLVALADSRRIMAQLVDFEPENLQPGQRVMTVVRRVMKPSTEGVIPYGIKVVPL